MERLGRRQRNPLPPHQKHHLKSEVVPDAQPTVVLRQVDVLHENAQYTGAHLLAERDGKPCLIACGIVEGAAADGLPQPVRAVVSGSAQAVARREHPEAWPAIPSRTAL